MKVLKFGGTSVANAQNINLVLDIVTKTAKTDQLVVVVSAFSGITDLLVLAAANASAKDKNYKEIVSEIEKKHKDAIEDLQPITEQSELIDAINSNIKHLKTLLDGCYLLGELSNRTSDTILSFGELLSSQIIAKALQQKIKTANFKDSREIIKTDNHFGKAVVNFEITDVLITNYFKKKNCCEEKNPKGLFFQQLFFKKINVIKKTARGKIIRS